MTRLTPLAAVVAVAVIAVGGLFLINRPSSGVIGTPSPSPSQAATPSDAHASPAAGALIPEALRYRWIGEPRPVGIRAANTRTGLNLSKDSYHLSATDLPSGLLGSLASVTGAGQITLVTPPGGDGTCATGATGVYAYSLSSGGTTLSMRKSAETCAARADAVVGDWHRVACKNTFDACWGDLEAGTFPTQYIDPRLDPGVTWAPAFGAMTFTVPAGWANSFDGTAEIALTPSSDYALEGATGGAKNVYHGIFVRAQPAAATSNATCANQEKAGVARTVDGLMDWIRSQPAVVASAPQPIVIDGHPGKWVDITLAPDWTMTCPDVGKPTAGFLTQAKGGAGGWGWGIDRGERERVILVDLGNNDVTMIAIDSSYPDRFDQLVTDAMPIIQTFHFN